ncbi:DUF6085 family protein [Streptomyces sp. NBC_01216]|uniref:DUF6085 family protein n=1 Tax=Streptomyces sp. NBC_01216 TaxID=2903778 RepID=UPI002E0DF59D|nr:DUF6085 family protein [Streptomyces sp. NBC_01216]
MTQPSHFGATVQGRCPACGKTSLFLGEGGYVTCARLDCLHPEAATELLEQPDALRITSTLAQLTGAVAGVTARLDEHVNAVKRAVATRGVGDAR